VDAIVHESFSHSKHALIREPRDPSDPNRSHPRSKRRR
jgi:hypothetical protein